MNPSNVYNISQYKSRLSISKIELEFYTLRKFFKLVWFVGCKKHENIDPIITIERTDNIIILCFSITVEVGNSVHF